MLEPYHLKSSWPLNCPRRRRRRSQRANMVLIPTRQLTDLSTPSCHRQESLWWRIDTPFICVCNKQWFYGYDLAIVYPIKCAHSFAVLCCGHVVVFIIFGGLMWFFSGLLHWRWGNPLQWRHNERNDVSKTPALRLFSQPFIQAQIKVPRHWPLCGEFTGDRWIPRTKGK